MASIWSGNLGFGMLIFPVSLHSGVQEQKTPLKQLCPVHRRPISMRRFCAGPAPAPGEAPAADAAQAAAEHEVDYGDLVSGFLYEDDDGAERYVVLTKRDLENAGNPIGKTFDIRVCVPADSVDVRFYDKPYLVTPQKGAAERPYALLREALRRKAMVAVGLIALRSKQHMAALRVMGDALVLHLMQWPDCLTELGELRFPPAEVREDEVRCAEELIDCLAGAIATAGFRDEYRANVEELIRRRIAGEEVEFEEAAASRATPVADLAEMLRRSVAARRAA